MIGYLVYTAQRRYQPPEDRVIGGMRFLQAAVWKNGGLRGRLAAARSARELSRRRIRQAVFPKDFPYGEIFAKRGILPIDTLPLYQTMAPQMLRYCLGRRELQPHQVTAAIVAERLDGELEKLITEIALQVRYVVLSVPGSDKLCAGLRREYGVSILQTSDRHRMEEAQALLLFAPAPRLRLENPVVLRLYDGQRVLRGNGLTLGLPGKWAAEMEPECEQEQLLAALYRAGIVQKYQIPIMEVDIGEKSYYNASTV